MTRINRNLSFFKRNHFIIFGVIWFLLGSSYLLMNLSENESRTFYYIIGSGYLIIGLGYFFQEFKIRSNKGEYIEWNHNTLIYKPNLGKVSVYKIENLINVTVAENNLIIKAPNAQGTMASLKGYSENDILKLREAFQKN